MNSVASAKLGAEIGRGTALRRCTGCGGVLTKPRATKWCSETCRIRAWHDRRCAREGLPAAVDVTVRSELLGMLKESQGLPVLRALCESWEQAMDVLAIPRRSDCEQALQRARSAPREALDFLGRTLAAAR